MSQRTHSQINTNALHASPCCACYGLLLVTNGKHHPTTYPCCITSQPRNNPIGNLQLYFFGYTDFRRTSVIYFWICFLFFKKKHV